MTWEKIANQMQGQLIAKLPPSLQKEEVTRIKLWQSYLKPESDMEYERRTR